MKQITFEFARLPTVFFDFCPADKKKQNISLSLPMAKKIENYNCEIMKCSVCKGVWLAIFDQRTEIKPYKSYTKKWRRYLAAQLTMGSKLFRMIISVFPVSSKRNLKITCETLVALDHFEMVLALFSNFCALHMFKKHNNFFECC